MVDPNVLSHNYKMGVLHLAVSLQRNDMIDLILMSDQTDINLVSPLHGTPLHLACKMGNLKIVQQLLINGADINIKSLKGKLAKDNTDNQRVIFLIEKYEKMRAMDNELEESSGESEGIEPNQIVQTSLIGGFISNLTSKLTEKKQSNLQQIEEEDIIDFNDDNMIYHIEKHAGSALDKAEQYIEDFQKSKVEIIPSI